MKITLTINGKQVKATVDDQEMKEAMGEKPEKCTGYDFPEPIRDRRYYMPNTDGGVEGQIPVDWVNGRKYYEKLYNNGLWITDKQVAENNVRADALMRKLRRFAAEHGGCVAPKNRMIIGMEPCCIDYRMDRNGLFVRHCDLEYPIAFDITFKREETAYRAIETFKDELLWYFTEYDPMPDGWWGN